MLGLVGAGRPTIWTDEAVTLSLLRRPPGEVLDVLGEVDAVHGLYYLALRCWTAVTGESIEAVRAFSALGVGVAAAGVVVLVLRYLPLPTAVAAGLATALLPGLSWAAVDGRSYAWAAALAVLATLALDDARFKDTRATWVLYGVLATVVCWWHLYLALLMLAHGIAVAAVERWALRTWLLTAACVGAATSPLALVAWGQRAQVSWLADVDYRWDTVLVHELVGGDVGDPLHTREVVAFAVIGLAAYGLVRRWQARDEWLVVLLGSWAAVPTALAVGSALGDAGWVHARYLAFAVPAFAAAAVIGAAELPRRTPLLVGAVSLLAVVPLVVAQRGTDAKPHDLRAVAETAVRSNASVVFTDPAARAVAAAYPLAFADNHDLSAVSDPHPDPFFDEVRDPATLAPGDVEGRRVLVYSTRTGPGVERLEELGCTGRTVLRDRGYRVRYYRCPAG
ncbi:hypothetical protein [Nocardioides stalactiti]|uniref:hypothetical protein n=1 Tax=Nocardioides stalactiti TaxID=2755356 RepID=UPI0016035104|nr:hypothetical protein [Nocardioides stalactiti]